MNNGNLKQFFKTHDRLLSVIGAIIVFATFVVREGLRERLKDTSDSIAAAQMEFVRARNFMYPTDTEFTLTIQNLGPEEEGIRKQMENPKTPFEDPRLETRLYILEYKAIQFYKKAFPWTNYNLMQLYNLSSTFKERDFYHEKIKQMWDRLSSITKELQLVPAPSGKHLFMERGSLTGDFPELADKALREALSFANDCMQLEKEILGLAEKERERAHVWFTRWTWTSYGLYTFGWGVLRKNSVEAQNRPF